MSKRLRIKLNLLVRRTWSNLTDLFTSTILQHLPHFCNFPVPFIDLVFFQKSILLFLLSLLLLVLLSLQLLSSQSQNNYC